jgi:hypothetical protein
MYRNIHSNSLATERLALASLILASLFVVLGPIGSIAGIICGNMALKDSKAAGIVEGDRMARAGIIIGWIGLGLFAIGVMIVTPILWHFYEVFQAIQNQ